MARHIVNSYERARELRVSGDPTAEVSDELEATTNHCATVTDRPDELGLDRASTSHPSFATGPHGCPATAAAFAVRGEALDALATTLPAYGGREARARSSPDPIPYPCAPGIELGLTMPPPLRPALPHAPTPTPCNRRVGTAARFAAAR